MTNTSEPEFRTEEEIVDRANELARKFYAGMGYAVPDNFKFYESSHPQEWLCWDMAVVAFAMIEGTDVKQALEHVEDEKV